MKLYFYNVTSRVLNHRYFNITLQTFIALFILTFLISAISYNSIYILSKNDGFTSSFLHILREGINTDYYPMYFSHIIRFFTIYPLYFFQNIGIDLANILLFVTLFTPIIFHSIINSKFRSQTWLLSTLLIPIIFLIFFISFRNYLVMLGITYLWILLTPKTAQYFHIPQIIKNIIYIFSFLFVNLSSGSLLIWSLLNIVFWKQIGSNTTKTIRYITFAVASLVLFLSVMHKVIIFSHTYFNLDLKYIPLFYKSDANDMKQSEINTNSYNLNKVNNIESLCAYHTKNMGLLYRSKLIELYTKCQYGKFLGYMFYTLAILGCIIISCLKNHKEKYFFIIILPFSMLEGLGFLSGFIVLYVYITYHFINAIYYITKKE